MPLSTSSPAASASSVLGRDADADHDGVGGDVAAVGQAHAAGPAVRAGDLGDPGAEPQVDAVCAVQGGVDLGHLAAEHPQQRQLGHLDAR